MLLSVKQETKPTKKSSFFFYKAMWYVHRQVLVIIFSHTALVS